MHIPFLTNLDNILPTKCVQGINLNDGFCSRFGDRATIFAGFTTTKICYLAFVASAVLLHNSGSCHADCMHVD